MKLYSRIKLPQITDPRGYLTFVEGTRHVPFEIKRVYYLYNVPSNSQRGGHAHNNLKQVLFALSGSFRITLDNGNQRETVWLNEPSEGILIEDLVWREMDCFSQSAVCMVLASNYYDESDYIRNYEEFTVIARSRL